MEKYGEVPKRFTKDWWEYFWGYYKWHTIGIVFAIVMTLVTVHQCANAVKYDMEIIFAGKTTFDVEKEQVLKDSLTDIIIDCDDNGEKNILIQRIAISEDAVDAELNQASAQKLSVEIMAGDAVIYIFTKDLADIYLNSDGCVDTFTPVSEWADEMPDKQRLCYSLGVPYAVNLSNSRLLSELGINTDDAYLMIRVERYNDKDNLKKSRIRESAILAANLLIGE